MEYLVISNSKTHPRTVNTTNVWPILDEFEEDVEYKVFEKDTLKDVTEDFRYTSNFSYEKCDSALGEIRYLINKHGYSCFLETAKGTSAWETVLPMLEDLRIKQNDLEVMFVYAALGKLQSHQIEDWKNNLN